MSGWRIGGAILAIACGLCGHLGWAQINTGRISGTLRDTTGAVISGARISATNDATGAVTSSKSTDSGEYLLNFLLPGKYHLDVEKEGFQREVERDAVVNAGGITRIDFSLSVGQVRQTVEVEANALGVATETSELSKTFGYTELDDLPNIDRNPIYQLNLLPGANSGVGSGNYGANGGENGSAIGLTRPQLVSLGGVDANANGVFIEGIWNREPQNAYVGLIPPIEAVQEVQIFTGKYNAEYGFSGSAVINVVTKSGSNEFHGALFEYLRNADTDAKNFFAESNTPFQRNQYGGALGGPILKNKLFFFADYQGTNYDNSSPGYTTVPTDKMYNGNFSELYNLSQPNDAAGNGYGQLYDPFSRVFGPSGNVVSATPFPGNIIPESLWDPAAAKMNNERIFGVANLPGISNNLYFLYKNLQTVNQGDGRTDYNYSEKNRFFFRYSHFQSTNENSTGINNFWQDGQADSNTVDRNMQLTHLAILSPTMSNEIRLGYNRTHVITSTKSEGQPYNNEFGIPNGNLGDPLSVGLALINVTGLHSIGDPGWVAHIISNTIALTENFTWVKGKHTLKFGTSINHVQETNADPYPSPRGMITFDPAMTSYNGAAAPYGYPSFLLGTMLSSERTSWVQGLPYNTYWQNAWYAQDDFKVLPSLTLNLGLRYELYGLPVERYNRQSNWDTATNQLVVASGSDRAPALNEDHGDWGPRVGFAWSPDHGKTSLRGGYGISYWQQYWGGPLTQIPETYPFFAEVQEVTPNNITPSLLLSRDGLPLATVQYDSAGNLVLPSFALIRGVAKNWKNQQVDQGNLNIQREIRRGMVLDVGYLHVDGVHNDADWIYGGTINVNQAPPQPPGANYNLARPLYSEYPQLGDVPVNFSTASSYYDALTVSFTGKINKNITWYTNYAHARSFSNGNNLDPSNINQYYGPTPEDIAHTFNAQVVFDLPFGKDQPFLSNMNRVLDTIFGGWRYSGFIHIASGPRFDVYSTVSLLNNGQSNRPNRVCNGAISNPTPNMWFNTSCFVDDLVPDTYGNAGINPLYADGMQQLDSSLFKKFEITERFNLQFRIDMFNTFNHPNFAAPDSTVGDATEGQVFSTSVDQRRMQFGLRLFF
jgi:Carboxypeptidase regulatory-like domain